MSYYEHLSLIFFLCFIKLMLKSSNFLVVTIYSRSLSITFKLAPSVWRLCQHPDNTILSFLCYSVWSLREAVKIKTKKSVKFFTPKSVYDLKIFLCISGQIRPPPVKKCEIFYTFFCFYFEGFPYR